MSVIPAPSLAVITTGGELVPVDQVPGQAQIRDSNGPMLAALAEHDGAGDVPRLLHADDRLEAILAALEQVADRDIILFTGGVSTGTYDLVPQAVRAFGAEVVFHKVKQKPGKPLLLASRGISFSSGCPAIHWPAISVFIATWRRPPGRWPASGPRYASFGRPARVGDPRDRHADLLCHRRACPREKGTVP